MKLGFSEKIITPKIGTMLVGYLPHRKSMSIEKDLMVKTIALIDMDKIYVWLTADLLGLSLYFKERLLAKLEENNIKVSDLQMFSTHTHSGPVCLNKDEYKDNNTSKVDKEYFDFLLTQSFSAIKASIFTAKAFTYKVASGKMENFQSNRISKDLPYDNDILLVEITFDQDKLLIYSFSGHPTILNSKSRAISPDYVGEVSLMLSQQYPENIFFNGACGDVSSRFTRKESSIEELKRLSKIAYNNVLMAVSNLGKSNHLKTYQVKHVPYKLEYKDFDSEDQAKDLLKAAKEKLDVAIKASKPKDEVRLLESKVEGLMVNLENSQKVEDNKFYLMNLYLIKIDEFIIINIASEIYSTLTLPLKDDNKTWVLSLSDHYQSYLVNSEAYKNNNYEAIASLYKENEAEKLVNYLKKVKANM